MDASRRSSAKKITSHLEFIYASKATATIQTTMLIRSLENIIARKGGGPNAIDTLSHFRWMLLNRVPFCFIRFSDGEIEILRNRYLRIAKGETHFRGRITKNSYPQYDTKEFNPTLHSNLRRDLFESAIQSLENYYKGVPTSHNGAVEDRDFLVRLNGGMSRFMTFADLLMNSNYARFRTEVVPIFPEYNELLVIANYRARINGPLEKARHISIGDNFFANYEETLIRVTNSVLSAEPGALVLSSASSLSNIVGYKSFVARPDLTFLDIGTSLNDLLGLDSRTRAYHEAYFGRGWSALRTRLSRQHWIRW